MNNKEINSLSFWFHVTDNCNLTCDYCYISTLETKKNMQDIVVYQFLDKLQETLKLHPSIKTITIRLAGGEPLTAFHKWKNSIEILITKLKKNNLTLQIRILTNLTILTDEMILFFKKCNIILGVSLDGLNDFHNKYRKFENGKGSFLRVENNITKLQRHNILFAVLVTISNDNIDGIFNLVKFLLDNNITFRLADAKGNYIDRVKIQEVLDKCYEIMDNYIEKGFSAQYKHILCDLNILEPSSTPCNMGVNACAIYIDGSIYFCHSQFGKNNSLGSLFDKEDIVTILKKGMKFHSLSEECQSCEFLSICAGGCPLYRTKDNKSPMCNIFKSSIPKIQKMIWKEEQLDKVLEND
jgi:uncharacterized protein